MTITHAPARRPARTRLATVAGAVALAAGAAVATAAPASAYTLGEVVDRIWEGPPRVRVVQATAVGTTAYEAWFGAHSAVDNHVAARGYQGCVTHWGTSGTIGYGDTWYSWKSLFCPVAAPLPPVTVPPAPTPEPIVGLPPAPQPEPDPEPTRRPGPRPIHTEIPR